MTPRETVIGAVAKGMFDASDDDFGNTPWDELDTEMKQWSWVEPATAALDALLATLPTLGLRVVPVEATEDMLDAMRLVFPDPCEEWDDVRLFGEEWAAALAASPNVLGDAP